MQHAALVGYRYSITRADSGRNTRIRGFVRECRPDTVRGSNEVESGYIHGFSRGEQRRLVAQARVLAPNVLNHLELPKEGRLLELGCGVGAELRLLARERPRLDLVGLDLSPIHLEAAKRVLAGAIARGRASLIRGDARALPLDRSSCDRVITIWMLEHASDPAAVMAEALRVLRPGGQLACTEVDNASFRFEPEQPAIKEWWNRFNRCQALNGGDPFVGRRLGSLAAELGCRDIRVQVLPVISSRRAPRRRRELLDYLCELLLSGAADLARRGLGDDALRRRVLAEFAAARRNAEIHFQYHALRLTCRPARHSCA